MSVNHSEKTEVATLDEQVNVSMESMFLDEDNGTVALSEVCA